MIQTFQFYLKKNYWHWVPITQAVRKDENITSEILRMRYFHVGANLPSFDHDILVRSNCDLV